MRKITLTIICAMLAIAALAQAPQGISHQAVIRNAANELIINSPVGIKVSILSGSTIYSEIHTPISNANGLISFVIGQGIVVSGVFEEINWAAGPYFLKTEADPTGGTTYTIEGITQILSVPYALFAGKSGDQTWNNNGNNIFYQNGNVGIGTNIPGAGLHLKGWNWPSSFMYLESGPGQDAGFRIYEGVDAKWHIFNQPFTGGLAILNAAFNPALFVKQADAYIGIGTTQPIAQLHTTGTLRFEGAGTPDDGKVLTSDASGNASWQPSAMPPGTVPGQMLYWNGTQWDEIEPGVHNQVLRFCNSVPTWGPCEIFSLTLISEPEAGGVLTGAGQYEEGDQVSVTAVANPGWQFSNWSDVNNFVVSFTQNFAYTMPSFDVTLIANMVEEQSGFTCGETLIDQRDGQTYGTVQIGNQCWMAENLNIGTIPLSPQTNNGIIEKYCYNSLGYWCDIFGGLYEWNEMMQYSTTQGSHGICPPGWHLPTDEEWTALTIFISSQPDFFCDGNTNWIAKSLAASTLWSSSSYTCTIGNNLSENNATGFSGLCGGNSFSYNYYIDMFSIGSWWSSTESSISHAWRRFLNFSDPTVNRNEVPKAGSNYVRCIKD